MAGKSFGILKMGNDYRRLHERRFSSGAFAAAGRLFRIFGGAGERILIEHVLDPTRHDCSVSDGSAPS